MAIAPISVGDTSARAKMNQAIEKANLVDGKAEQVALSAEATARQQAVSSEATARQQAISAETTARQQGLTASQQALSAEATSRQEGDAAEAQARSAAVAALDERIDGRASYTEVVAEHDRPGEPGRFATADLGGAPESVALLDGSKVVSPANGAVVALRAGYVAPVAVRRIEPGRHYRLRFVLQRAEDTADPANDAVRLGIAWLKADKSKLAETVMADVLDVLVSSGRLEFSFTVSRVDGDTVDVVCPAGAVYARPFLRCYGAGLTHVEVIEWSDLSNAVDWSPDVSGFLRQLAGMEYGVTSLSERMALAESGLEAAHDARYIKSGTLDDARLSGNVLLRDAEQSVTGDKTFEAALRMVGPVLLAPRPDGGAAARIAGDGDSFAIAPTNGAGGFDTLKEFGFNPVDGFWRVESGFRVGVEMRAGSLQATPIGTVVPAAASFTVIDVTDKPASRANLDVYSKAETDSRFEHFDALVRKGALDCSSDPDYPAAEAGHVYVVSVAGRIGGGAGAPVEAGDFLICNVDGSAAGTQAAVGVNWTIGQINIDVSAFARLLLAEPDAEAMRATLGLAIGTDVQAQSAELDAIAALAPDDDVVIQRKGGAWVARSPRQLLADLRKQATVATDAAFTLTPGTSAEVQCHTGTLTADRTITLGSGQNGDVFEIARTGSGAFNLSVGGLKNLATNSWCRVVHDGTGWHLTAAGTL